MNHPGKKFLDDIPIHAFVDKDTLLDYLVLECGCMKQWSGHGLLRSHLSGHGHVLYLLPRLFVLSVPLFRGSSPKAHTHTTDTANKKDLVDNEHTEKTWSENGSNDETDVHFPQQAHR